MQNPEAYVNHVDKALDDEGRLTGGTRELVQKFVVAYAEWVERFAGAKAQDSAA